MSEVANPRVSKWYDRVVSSLDKCVFCDLKEKYIIAENGDWVLTVNLFPYLDGHLLVIPRTHKERFGEITSGDWNSVRYLLNTGVKLLEKAFNTGDSNILYREGGVGSGKSLGHLHFHIMPCVPGFLDRNGKGIVYTYQELKIPAIDMAKKFRMLFKTDDSNRTDKEFMQEACLLCDKSTCGYKTGCVIVRNGEIIAKGWNATLPGEVYCQNGSCIREKEHLHGGKEPDKVCSIHAEANAIAECARIGISVEGADMYISTYPCMICARLIAKAGIKRLFYMSEYPGGKIGQSVLTAHGVEVIQIKESDVWLK